MLSRLGTLFFHNALVIYLLVFEDRLGFFAWSWTPVNKELPVSEAVFSCHEKSLSFFSRIVV